MLKKHVKLPSSPLDELARNEDNDEDIDKWQAE